MKLRCGTILAAAVAVAVTASAETIFEAKGSVTDKTPGFRFGNVTFTDNDRVCAKFDAVEMSETAKIQWWDEFVPCYTWLFGSGLPFEWYSRDTVHSGELGKQIIGRVMLGYFLTGR